MRVIVFGATGTVGSKLVAQALEAGHQVTAFVRDPQRVAAENENLSVIRGDVLDPVAVARAVRGHDAVLCALGAGLRGRVRAQGTRNIIAAMEAAGVPRLVCQTTLGVGESRQHLNFYWKYLMFGGLLRLAYADHVAQEQHILDSELEWTIVRPAAFTDGARTGTYVHGFSADTRDLSLTISRSDVADFMLQQLDDDTYLRRAPGLSYAA